jgi:hypothetical protein
VFNAAVAISTSASRVRGQFSVALGAIEIVR